MNVTTLNEIPDLPALYRSLMLGAVPIPGLGAGKRKVEDSQTAYRVDSVGVDTEHLARYCQATGLRLIANFLRWNPCGVTGPLAPFAVMCRTRTGDSDG